MSTQAQAEKAIGLLNGSSFHDRTLRGSFGRPREDRVRDRFQKGEAVVREEVPRVEVGSD